MSSDITLSGDLIQRAKSYTSIIEKVYAGSNQDINESQLLGELLKLLSEVPPDYHLFCDPIINPISIFCLTIFSFNEQDTVNWIKNKFNPILSKCEKCILNFTRGKCNMLQHFAIQRNVPHEHVSKFNDIVCQWRTSCLFPVLQNIKIINDKTVDLTTELEMTIYESICNPHMLRLDKNFKNYFDVIFKYLYNSKNKLLDFNDPDGFNVFVPGIIYCWCEGSQEEINWSRDFLKNLHQNNVTISATSLTADILQEVYFHLLFIENPANWNEIIVSQFWIRFYPIFKLFEKDVFLEYFVVPKNIESLKQNIRYPIESIFILWYNHLVKQYNDKPLDFLLRILKMFLHKLGSDFWNKIEPYSFHSILDTIFERDTFAKKLLRIQDVPLPNNELDHIFASGSVSDLLSWTLPFYQSLSTSKRIQMVKKVSISFLRVIANNPSLKSLPKACLMNSSTALLSQVLTITKEERFQLYHNEDFQTILFTKTDSRTLLNNPLIQNIMVASATDPSGFYPGLGAASSSVAEASMTIITKCIDYDILLLCQRTYKLYAGKSISDLPMPLTLLENTTAKMDLRSFTNGPLLAKELLVSLRNVNGLLPVPGKSPTVEKHNATVASYIAYATKLIEKFTDILPKQLSLILAEKEPSLGFWSCIFSSNTQLYQAATNILYDTFDVEGRLEGIQFILNHSLNNQLTSINNVLKQLIKCEFYEPCPRAVRVLMDITSAFADPIGGIMANYSTLKNAETDKAVAKFWQYSWYFMDTIYRCTLTWASKYDYSELENFTKDTLELSRSLVSSYREISDILGKTEVDLFDCVLKTFNNMLYWLRLSDEELLDSCVKLIIATADLAQEKNIKFDDTLIEQMAKYASKSRKFSNKLSDTQTSEILSKAKLFNSDITNRVIEEAETYHKEKDMLKLKAKGSASPTPSQSPIESKADFLQRKALSSSIMGRPKPAQPKITSFGNFQSTDILSRRSARPVKPLSRMEQARRQLLNNRVVHPPSTSVFHTKQTLAKPKNEDLSSDESDAEVDIQSARELFASTKHKDKGIEILDVNGKALKKDTLAQRKKMEEENMRKRLNVDLNPLYETILQWDYNRNNEYPTDDGIEKYSDIPDEFTSSEQYHRIMKPLLLLECWQGLCSARDREDNNPFSIVVGNRTAVSDFYEVYTSVPKQMLQKGGISESDLIVLAYLPDQQRGSRLTSDNFKAATHTCLAKVRNIKYTKNESADLTLRIHRNHKFSKFLTLRAEIFAVKVMQMTTVEREFQTLEGLEYYNLVNQILLAKCLPPPLVPPEEIEKVKTKYKLNLSQAEAIINSVMKEGFSLIQGPPGTGKTKTILGIIGYFLSIVRAQPSNIIKVPTADASTQTLEHMLKKQKILICAPSNAAVDEICLRLKDGVLNTSGVMYRPNVVRVGRSDAVNAAIKDLTLEELVESKLGEKSYEYTHNPELDRKFNDAVNERRKLRAKLNAEDGLPSSTLSNDDIAKLQLDIRQLSKVLNELGKQRDEIREKNSITYRSRDLHRRNAQMQVLAGSDIICSTLSGSAHDVLATLGITFDTVIIDEACQCTELSSIIPLRYGCQRCIMVGDPNQLPPTVLSGAASNYKYNQSLFVRMSKHSEPFLLNVQYRMHPDISRFPSLEFYNGKLKDGPDMDVINKRPWHECPPLTPYKFFNIATGQQEKNIKTMSLTNSEEVRVAIELIDFLFKRYEAKVDFAGKIGIISPYREQMQKMRTDFVRHFGGMINKYIDFNTIDGFQGQEKEIIVISCVRADENNSSVGFLKDFRRMNVAFTRAKASLWILGHERSLVRNKLWNHLITDAHSRKCVEEIQPGYFRGMQAYASRFERSGVKHGNDESDHYDPLTTIFGSTKRNKLEEIVDKPLKSKKREFDDIKGDDLDDKKKKKKKKKDKDRGEKRPMKSNLEKKEGRHYLKSEGSQIPAGTKKKSSIFGGTTLSDDMVNQKPTITKKKAKSKFAEKHISFSDDITYISDAPSKNVDTKKAGTEKKIKLSSILSKSKKNTEDDGDDDYNPADYVSQQTKFETANLKKTKVKVDELSSDLVSFGSLDPEVKSATQSTTDNDTVSTSLVSIEAGPQDDRKSIPHRPSPLSRPKERRRTSSSLFIPKRKPPQKH
ncbi:helicase Sen1p [Monosporozyma unispora]